LFIGGNKCESTANAAVRRRRWGCLPRGDISLACKDREVHQTSPIIVSPSILGRCEAESKKGGFAAAAADGGGGAPTGSPRRPPSPHSPRAVGHVGAYYAGGPCVHADAASLCTLLLCAFSLDLPLRQQPPGSACAGPEASGAHPFTPLACIRGRSRSALQRAGRRWRSFWCCARPAAAPEAAPRRASQCRRCALARCRGRHARKQGHATAVPPASGVGTAGREDARAPPRGARQGAGHKHGNAPADMARGAPQRRRGGRPGAPHAKTSPPNGATAVADDATAVAVMQDHRSRYGWPVRLPALPQAVSV
jgi:hypothetical protein